MLAAMLNLTSRGLAKAKECVSCPDSGSFRNRLVMLTKTFTADKEALMLCFHAELSYVIIVFFSNITFIFFVSVLI